MPLLIDTNILIDYLRGQPDGVSYLDSVSDEMLISAVTVAELYAGVREGSERTALDGFVRSFEVVLVSNEIAVKGGLYKRDYGKSHNVDLPDALIAATAEIKGAQVVTLNKKHFPMFTDVIVPYYKT